MSRSNHSAMKLCQRLLETREHEPDSIAKGSTYLGAVIRKGGTATDLWTGVFLGQAPLNCAS
jgi:hypothetical protein